MEVSTELKIKLLIDAGFEVRPNGVVLKQVQDLCQVLTIDEAFKLIQHPKTLTK